MGRANSKVKKRSSLLTYPSPGKIYLIPTRYGVLFSLGILMILVVAITYGNNLAYLLCFNLGSTILVSMVFTHFNLEGPSLIPSPIHPHFVGKNGVFKFQLKNERGRPRYSLGVEMGRPPDSVSMVGEQELFLSAYGESDGVLFFTNDQRGPHHISWVKIYSTFPLGLFYAWKWIPVDLTYWVYPHPRDFHIAPETFSENWSESRAANVFLTNGEDFSHHRNYWPGDSLRHVDWKAFARGAGLLVKEFQEGGKENFIFSWQKLARLSSDEERLSQMTFWILLAESSLASFSMELPSFSTFLAHGPLHIQQCLEYCASYPALPSLRAEGGG